MTANILTQSKLKSLVHYDPETGLMKSLKTGYVFGTMSSGTNYIQACLCGVVYPVHRLAFMYMTGEFPPVETDHINREIQDNRWSNLRAVSVMENQRNAKVRVDNTSGTPGVTWHKRYKTWQAKMKIKGVTKHIGYFKVKEDAISARIAFKTEILKTL